MTSCAPPDPPEEDRARADKLGLTFVLSKKMARKKPWIRISSPASLRETVRAMTRAPSGRVPWEVGIFRLHANGAGFIDMLIQ
jgi:hypothetical protein